jgi:phage tail-like protein
VTPRAVDAASFLLEIDGISSAAFVRCSGLGGRVGVVEHLEGGHGIRRFPGEASHGNIVLERAVSADHELEEWFGKGDRRDGAVVLLSPSGKEVCRWAFTRGWPCRWEGPVLDARGREAAIEVLEIAHEGVHWVAR